MFFFMVHFSSIVTAGDNHDALAEVIVFSSYQDGNWDVWLLKPDDQRFFRLTRGGDEKHRPAISPDHETLAWATNRGEIWLWKEGHLERLEGLPGHCNFPAWSPDATEVACACFSFNHGIEDSNLWLANVERGAGSVFLIQPGIIKYPAFSPDGSFLFYSLAIVGSRTVVHEDIWQVSSDGKHSKCLIAKQGDCIHPVISHDGRWLLYASDISGNMEIWKASRDGHRRYRITSSPALDTSPRWSPDDREVVFVSTRSGRYDLWVMEADGNRPRNLTGAMQGDCVDPDWGFMKTDVFMHEKRRE